MTPPSTMPASSKPVLLIDGSAILRRAFHALPKLTAPDGHPTGALYGMAQILRRLINDSQPERLAVVFDAPGKTFRHTAFPDYKAHRPPPDPDLIRQIAPIQEFVQAMGVPLLQVPGVEADDVLATLTHQAVALGWPVWIVSSDKDLTQLLALPQVCLLDPLKNRLIDAAAVRAQFGVPPEHMTDWLALVGDAADHLPGVPGVGPKTAAKWLQQYGSLAALIANAAALPGTVGARFRQHLDQVVQTQRLVTLDGAVPLPLHVTDLNRRPPDSTGLRALCERYAFHSWLKELPPALSSTGPVSALSPLEPYPVVSTQPHPALPPAAGCLVPIRDLATLKAWLTRWQTAELGVLDVHTAPGHPLDAPLRGLAFAIAPGEAAYLPLFPLEPQDSVSLDQETVWAILRPVLEKPQPAKLGYRLKSALHALASHGITLCGLRHDLLLESYVLESSASHELAALAERHGWGTSLPPAAARTDPGSKQRSRSADPAPLCPTAAAAQANLIGRLHRELWPRLAAVPDLHRVYEELEMPLLPVLARMERLGVAIDAAALRQYSHELAKRLWQLEQQAFDLAGERFNLHSPKQLHTILFERLRLPIRKKTSTGQPSTAEEALHELALDSPLPQVILEYRSLSKLKATYTDRLPAQIHPATGRIHTTYHQTMTRTGRLSSSEPNLQNIPVRTPEGRRIRQAFIPAPGFVLLSADYAQIELRLMAHLSGDPGLIHAFATGIDVHRATAAEIFGIAPEAVTAEQRRSAKAINFGLMYGLSAFGLAQQLGIAQRAAQTYVERYFARYPGVKAYLAATRRQAAEQGYVCTLWGRRINTPEIRSRNVPRRHAAERAAINAPVQGSAADLIKRAMLAIDRWLQQSNFPARMILQVHDELVFEVAEGAVAEAEASIRAFMVNAATLRVPLAVSTGTGTNWDEAHKS